MLLGAPHGLAAPSQGLWAEALQLCERGHSFPRGWEEGRGALAAVRRKVGFDRQTDRQTARG